jgi:hypothetical protein
VATGAALTGISLTGGLVLAVIAFVALLSHGGELAAAGLGLGLVLLATHWGWVHVAELTADRVQTRGQRPAVEARQAWLESVAPYSRYEVTTEVAPDGGIVILTVAFCPVPASSGHFTFTREVVAREEHSDEAPAAFIAERAETLRQEAAARTDAERERYRAVAGDHETAQLTAEDEQERLAIRQAASRALSAQINAHLRQPPLDG